MAARRSKVTQAKCHRSLSKTNLSKEFSTFVASKPSMTANVVGHLEWTVIGTRHSLRVFVQLLGISQAFVNQQAVREKLTQDHRIGPECNGRIRRAAGHPPLGRFVEGPLRVLWRVAPCFWIPPSAFPQQTAGNFRQGADGNFGGCPAHQTSLSKARECPVSTEVRRRMSWRWFRTLILFFLPRSRNHGYVLGSIPGLWRTSVSG
ncbi:hypothetical protein EDD36DRAFT_55221 [Exophiala viscosa]|uniref:Uncharacterized protein n=1 Tax=Exophiala viscosa TaxID=2486360 RepID=A0AAN6DR07_9EURO|nr:hypothetical protein EDD36DRAFT_55221 [Exophiala viscosa]